MFSLGRHRSSFASISGKDFIIIQFLEFMKTQGLGPLTPLSMSGLVALLEAPKAEEGISGAIKALKGMDWEIVPERYRANPEIKRTWGATAIYFATQGWNPTISIGFLIDPTDHQVQMTNPDKGIDLMLRIISHPNNLGLDKIGSVIAELKNRKKALGTDRKSVV